MGFNEHMHVEQNNVFMGYELLMVEYFIIFLKRERHELFYYINLIFISKIVRETAPGLSSDIWDKTVLVLIQSCIH